VATCRSFVFDNFLETRALIRLVFCQFTDLLFIELLLVPELRIKKKFSLTMGILNAANNIMHFSQSDAVSLTAVPTH
jgi:hypothetical protein